MRKIKLWVGTGFINAEHTDFIEVEDDITEEELDKIAEEFMWEHICCGWSEVEGEEE